LLSPYAAAPASVRGGAVSVVPQQVSAVNR
jgi:hypothetical protein